MKTKDIVLLEQAYEAVVENKLQALKDFSSRPKLWKIRATDTTGFEVCTTLAARDEQAALRGAHRILGTGITVHELKQVDDESDGRSWQHHHVHETSPLQKSW